MQSNNIVYTVHFSGFVYEGKGQQKLRLILLFSTKMASRVLKYACDLSVLKARGIDVAASNFTALVHFRGSW